MSRANKAWLAAALGLLGACRGAPGRARPAGPSTDAGGRVRAVAEVPPLGPSADGSEVDVPLDWVYLLTAPSPTGSAPYAAVGVTPPCGFRVLYVTADRGDGRVLLRARARREAPGPARAADARCDAPTPTAQLVSLGVLRLGDWRVEDALARQGPGDAGRVPPVVQRVVPDDRALAPLMARWTRPCGAGCGEGGVCMRLAGSHFCAAPRDPWRSMGQPCPAGSAAAEAEPSRGGAAREVCLPLCEGGSRCAPGLRCVAGHGVCVPG
ncbi:MAG: hypothetical protein HY909_12745 [Deltaproteobacteria bacterium]|nr:hypothetical protein [Deltaproteobacteria bacterium]